jgi:hypothetical protein
MELKQFDNCGLGILCSDRELFYRTYGGKFSGLTLGAAVELDRYIQGREMDFYCVKKLTEVIRANLITGDELKEYHVDVDVPLWNAMREGSEKQFSGDVAEYALEMRLLYAELTDFRQHSAERVKELMGFCAKLSKEYHAEEYRSRRCVMTSFQL